METLNNSRVQYKTIETLCKLMDEQNLEYLEYGDIKLQKGPRKPEFNVKVDEHGKKVRITDEDILMDPYHGLEGAINGSQESQT